MKPNRSIVAIITLALSCVAVACGGPSGGGSTHGGPPGIISLTVSVPSLTQTALPLGMHSWITLPGGDQLNALAYSLVGVDTYTGTGDISNTPSFDIAPVASGPGYVLTLSGTTILGASCSGTSSSFSVAPAVVTPVSIAISCSYSTDGGAGAVAVTATINASGECPSVVWAVSGSQDVSNGASTTVTVDIAGSASSIGNYVINGAPTGWLSLPTWIDSQDYAATLTCKSAQTLNLTALIQSSGCPNSTLPLPSITCE